MGLLAFASILYIPLLGSTTTYKKPAEVVEEPKEEVIEVPPILKEIGRCESGNKQFHDDGSVVRGIINPDDIGKYQINLYYHAEAAQKLGYDLFTEEGNTKYAIHLYDNAGTTPWNWSKHCWDPHGNN